MLKRLHLKNVGPSPEMEIALGERLNLLTGDNGLGKTFLLDIAWWALTGSWAGQPAWPDPDFGGYAEIGYTLKTLQGGEQDYRQLYIPGTQDWPWSAPGHMKDLVVYARVDEGFSVWDPARNYWKHQPDGSPPDWPEVYHFTQETLWNGLDERGALKMGWRGDAPEVVRENRVFCNGLIRDWVDWQLEARASYSSSFEFLIGVLRKLSPDPAIEIIEPAEPKRVLAGDARKIPTISLPYGTIPLIYASAGMKRVISLAYVLVWTWHEHVEACRILRRNPAESLILLIDEVESHLHPKWQRSILPALMEAAKVLSNEIRTQVIATTHAPLVLASVEPFFDAEKDTLSLLEDKEGRVTLRQLDHIRYGDAASWLVSPVFGLGRARSKEAERALDAAYAYMRNDDLEKFDGLRTGEAINAELARVLSESDPFWPGWRFHLERERPQ